MDKLSIDLKATLRGNKINFTCFGGDKIDIDYPLNMKQEDLGRLYQDIQRIGAPLIVECSYDHWNGNWNYHMIRTDKDKPNHIRVILDTLETISENVSKEEIMYRVSITEPRLDDWKGKVRQSYQRILDEQNQHK
jgi:hypothetical protein